MLDGIDSVLIDYINEAAVDLGYKTDNLGSEVLLLALLLYPESICNFALKNQHISPVLLKEEIKCLKQELKGNVDDYRNIIKLAKEIAQNDRSNIIYDEHLFYAILVSDSTVANDILIKCKISIDEVLDDVANLFSLNDCNNYLDNLTKKALDKKLNPFIGRTKLINKVIRVLSKKQKNNCMLIGSAGVGKSALVEGVVSQLVKTDKQKTVYRLDIASIVAGTKYRGDLEERLVDVLEIAKKPNVIIFIDEIHNIVNNNNENNLDIANILKPALARGEIKCIGATTTDEYYRIIEKDKALMRRFDNIFISEPNTTETLQILNGIKDKYESFHNIKVTTDILNYIIELSSLLPNRKLPDKAIDILDEAGLVASINNNSVVTRSDVLKVILEMNGLDDDYQTKLGKLKFKELTTYYQQFFSIYNIRPVIVSVKIKMSDLSMLLKDFELMLNIKKEAILTLDAVDYVESHYNSLLIGSPPGYVGYDDGGILTEHVIKYPVCAIVIKNFKQANANIIRQIKSIIKEGSIMDAKGRTVYFTNCCFVFIKEATNNTIGFCANKQNDDYIDLEVNVADTNYIGEVKRLIKRLAVFEYYINFDYKSVDYTTYLNIKDFLLSHNRLKSKVHYNLILTDKQPSVQKVHKNA